MKKIFSFSSSQLWLTFFCKNRKLLLSRRSAAFVCCRVFLQLSSLLYKTLTEQKLQSTWKSQWRDEPFCLSRRPSFTVGQSGVDKISALFTWQCAGVLSSRMMSFKGSGESLKPMGSHFILWWWGSSQKASSVALNSNSPRGAELRFKLRGGVSA